MSFPPYVSTVYILVFEIVRQWPALFYKQVKVWLHLQGVLNHSNSVLSISPSNKKDDQILHASVNVIDYFYA